MKIEHTIDEIRQNKDVRMNIVLQDLEEWSKLFEEMNNDYIERINERQKLRLDMLKYLGTISGGAAALSPQLLDRVYNDNFFYMGIILLCIVVVFSGTYVLAIAENESTELELDLRKKNNMLNKFRKPKILFLEGEDHSFEAFQKAIAVKKEDIPKEKEFKIEKVYFKSM